MALVAGSLLVTMPPPTSASPDVAVPTPVVDGTLARSPELSESTRLADRRMLVTGTRAWAMGTADGRYPAAGFHTRGEMGGFWLPNLKLLDGMWFGIDDAWIGPGTRTTSGWGYVRTDLPVTKGVSASRTDVVPDGKNGVLVGLSLRSASNRTITLRADAHSELMGSYPWGETSPSQKDVNLADTAVLGQRHLGFRDRGTPPDSNGEAHNWGAAFGSTLEPTGSEVGENYRGPQDPAVICPASGPDAPPQPDEPCDDTEYGNGAGGRLTYEVRLRAGEVRTVWFGVGGSTRGLGAARTELRSLLDRPARSLARKVASRRAVDRSTIVDLPGDRLLQQSVRWSKQMLAASDQRVEDPKLRIVRAGKQYPPPKGTIDSMRWLGAGWPDYPWLFGTDGEYTAYAAVAAGQFAPIKAHLRALRDVSVVINGRSGKIVHEVTPDGAVYFGANADPGNTDESSKYPSAVALVWRWTGDKAFLRDLYPASVRAMRYVASLDEDGDGWPEGLGNVEREGMGEEKLDNTVYTIRGFADLADMARARGDRRTERWAIRRAARMQKRFESAWWYDQDGAKSYADSLDDPDEGGTGPRNEKVFQRHWIGLTPTDAVLPGVGGRKPGPLASREHANTTLTQHELPCYTEAGRGLFHTGTGPTSAPAGNPGASCDTVVSAVPGERSIFTLNSAIAAVSEGNYGRLDADQQGVYTSGNARSQLDRTLWEMPGAMPEIVPGGDFGANIDRKLTERSMVLQAWGSYGTLWPVVHQWLGVSPDLGRGRVSVVPQVPDGQSEVSGRRIRVGGGSVAVHAEHHGRRYVTEVARRGRVGLTIGATLPRRTRVGVVRLNGRVVRPRIVQTARGTEVRYRLAPSRRAARLVVKAR